MSIGGVNPVQGGYGSLGVGQQPGGVNDLRQQIESLKQQIEQQKSQGGGSQGAGGSQGSGESLEELLMKLLEQLKAREGLDGQGIGGEQQQGGAGSGSGQIQFPPPQ